MDACLGDRPHWLCVMTGVFFSDAAWIVATADPEQATAQGLIPSPHEGFAAPDFELETLDGGRLRLSDLLGEVAAVNSWATWCPPCKAVMPTLQRPHEAHRPAGLVVLGVDATDQDSLTAVHDFVSKFGLPVPIRLDSEGAVSRAYALRVLPSICLVDRDGVMREVILRGAGQRGHAGKPGRAIAGRGRVR